MVLKNFDDIRQNMKSDTKRTVAVASAIEDKTLEAVLEAHDMGLVDYILTGPRDEILKTADEIGRTVDRSRIIDAESDHESAVKAVELIRPYGVSLKDLKRSADDTPHFFISKFIIEICAGA